MIISTTNCLLAKTEVGRCRPSYHSLPPAGFVYGKHFATDKEGANELISKWSYHKNTESPKKEKSFVLMNSLSVASGLSTSKDFKLFRKSLKEKPQRTKSLLTKIKEPEKIYGKALMPSTPIKAVVENFYGNATENIQNNEKRLNVSFKANGLQKIQKLPPLSPPTNPSFSGKTLFKMKKFLAGKSRVNCWRCNE